jgi:putative IMPACT (imprinted ancient) family translation regulator
MCMRRVSAIRTCTSRVSGWSVSESIHDRKSTFIGRAAVVSSDEEAREKLALLKQNKKIAKASHNITAWRISGDKEVSYEAYNNDGEPPSGEHLLTFLRVRWKTLFNTLTCLTLDAGHFGRHGCSDKTVWGNSIGI